MERFGLSPVATRINALLTIADETALSFDEIRSTLQIGKSAIRKGLNTLVALGFVNFKTILGDRKRYFYSEIGSWKAKMSKDFEVLLEFAELLNQINIYYKKKDVFEYSRFFTKPGNSSISSLQSKD